MTPRKVSMGVSHWRRG